jgi:thiamine biosynthesis protein ThiI
MYKNLIINVDELWLKGKNRPVYYRSVHHHVQELLKHYHTHKLICRIEDQRLIARSEMSFSKETMAALLKVPGIHSVIPCRPAPLEVEAILPVVIEEIDSLDCSPRTFKIETKRSYKQFLKTSMEVSSEIGKEVLVKFPKLKVDLTKPELVIEIRILKSGIYISSQKLLGMGGLPFGTSGHLVSLLSGGFDSPVASYLMTKRGCRLTYVFFYAYPFVGDEAKEKVVGLVKILGRYQLSSQLYVVSFGDIQDKIAKNCRKDYRTLLFRKAMIECANLLAEILDADALLTGDALGQVSSQTVFNLSVLDMYSKRPVFRPLVGYNKSEIITLSRKIGTHDISVRPHDDACNLFAPKHPIINPDKAYLERFSSRFPLDKDLKMQLQQAEVFGISLSGEITSHKGA